jgi:hypothetical protein
VKRDEIVSRLEIAWHDFLQSYAGLSSEQLLEPGVTGKWSVRDILAHVTTWEEEALKHLPVILNGGIPSRYSVMYGGIDAFNAQMTEKKSGLSLAEVLHELNEVHLRLIEFINGVGEDQFHGETRFRRRLRLDTYSHYPKHARAIRKWRQGRASIYNSQ